MRVSNGRWKGERKDQRLPLWEVEAKAKTPTQAQEQEQIRGASFAFHDKLLTLHQQIRRLL
jgi:hypothetical protein